MYNNIKSIKEGVAEIYLYSSIDSVSAENFLNEFLYLENSEDVNQINLSIISSGGSVIEGQKIFATLLGSTKPVHIYIKGIVASISSLIALAGSKVYMYDYATIMWHNTHLGGREPNEKEAKALGALNESLTTFYNQRTGLSSKKISKWMEEETWFNAKDALKNGLVDEIIETGKRVEKTLENSFLEEVYNECIDLISDEFPTEKIKSDEMTEEIQNQLTDYKNQLEEISAKVSEYEASIATLTGEKETLTTELEGVKNELEEVTAKLTGYQEKEQAEKEKAAIEAVENAIKAGKIKEDGKDAFLTLAKNDLTSFNAMMDNIVVPVQEKLSDLIVNTVEDIELNFYASPVEQYNNRKNKRK